jgi:hypothetical protein
MSVRHCFFQSNLLRWNDKYDEGAMLVANGKFAVSERSVSNENFWDNAKRRAVFGPRNEGSAIHGKDIWICDISGGYH